MEHLMKSFVSQCPPFLVTGRAELSLESLCCDVVEKKVGWLVSACVEVSRWAFGWQLAFGESALSFVSEGKGKDPPECLI